MVKVRIVFGQTASGYVEDVIGAVHNSEEENPKTDKYEAGAKELMTFADGDSLAITEHEFATEAEADAYLLGVYEGEGWMGYYTLDDEQTQIIEKVLEAKGKLVTE